MPVVQSRPRWVFADRGCDLDKYRNLLSARGITPKIARRSAAHGPSPGRCAGSSSALLPGYISSNVLVFVPKYKLTYITDCSSSLASIICLTPLQRSF